MVDWTITGCDRKKGLLNKKVHDFAYLSLDKEHIRTDQMQCCDIALCQYDKWKAQHGDTWVVYDNYNDCIRDLKATPYIVLYEFTFAKWFKTKEELSNYYTNEISRIEKEINSREEELKKLIDRKEEMCSFLRIEDDEYE